VRTFPERALKIAIFSTTGGGGMEFSSLKELLARNGKDCTIVQISTAAAGTANFCSHYITVVYVEGVPA
jgi:hypothetical protein